MKLFRPGIFSALLVPVLFTGTAAGATLPAGFNESVVASGISSPTAMAFAPDGRWFVCQQNGALRVIKQALGLRNPFTLGIQPGTGRMFINDVGQNTWEEINDDLHGILSKARQSVEYQACRNGRT